MTEPDDALVKEYEHFFNLCGVQVSFSSTALEAIANLAFDKQVGARGLRAVFNDIAQTILLSKNVYKTQITERDILDLQKECLS